MRKSCYELSDCDVARPKNAAPWYEMRENSLYFSVQTWKIIDTPDENGYFIIETMEISRCKLKRTKEIAQNRKRRPSFAVSILIW